LQPCQESRTVATLPRIRTVATLPRIQERPGEALEGTRRGQERF
jgi:hypothetical protein